MRLPNGYGSVYKLSGKRRKPYVARKTTGFTYDEETEKSFPIYKYIGYYETKKEALQALSDYNNNPLLIPQQTTFAQLYDKWSEIEYRGCSDSFKRVYQAAYKVMESVYKMPVANLALDDYQNIIDGSGKNLPTLKKVKSLICKMYDYALVAEIITPAKREMVNHINLNNAENPNNLERIPFTKAEVDKLWKLGEDAHGILVMIYTGLRISEFSNLKRDDVYLKEKWFFVRKSKTKAGVRRVPIAEKILPVFEHWMNKGNEYVFENCHPATTEGKVSYFLWDSMMKEFNMNHTPHDSRHTCVTEMIKGNVNVTIIKKIVGHASGDVTEDVYGHADMKDMREAINKIFCI